MSIGACLCVCMVVSVRVLVGVWACAWALLLESEKEGSIRRNSVWTKVEREKLCRLKKWKLFYENGQRIKWEHIECECESFSLTFNLGSSVSLPCKSTSGTSRHTKGQRPTGSERGTERDRKRGRKSGCAWSELNLRLEPSQTSPIPIRPPEQKQLKPKPKWGKSFFLCSWLWCLPTLASAMTTTLSMTSLPSKRFVSWSESCISGVRVCHCVIVRWRKWNKKCS